MTFANELRNAVLDYRQAEKAKREKAVKDGLEKVKAVLMEQAKQGKSEYVAGFDIFPCYASEIIDLLRAEGVRVHDTYRPNKVMFSW